MTTIYCGVDPGRRGGIFAMTFGRKIVCKRTIPLTPCGRLDFNQLRLLLQQIGPDIICLEENFVRPTGARMMSAASATAMMRMFGNIEGAIASLGYRHRVVTPREWQHEMHAGLPTKFNAKQKSYLAAIRLFPEETFLPDDATPRMKKAHDGIVDAALIAVFASL